MYRIFLLISGVLLAFTVSGLVESGRTQASPAGTPVTTAIPTDSGSPLPVATPLGTPGAVTDPIKHIVIIVKENRSFDNYFGTFPGADGTTKGRLSDGRQVPLIHTPDHTLLDIGHAGDAARI